MASPSLESTGVPTSQMFSIGPVSDLRPNSLCAVTVCLRAAIDTPPGCIGVGGAPGESVWIKGGVTAVEPLAARDCA